MWPVIMAGIIIIMDDVDVMVDTKIVLIMEEWRGLRVGRGAHGGVIQCVAALLRGD